MVKMAVTPFPKSINLGTLPWPELIKSSIGVGDEGDRAADLRVRSEHEQARTARASQLPELPV